MTILSSLFLLNNTKSIWQLVCKEPAGSIYNCRNLKYSPVYKGYVGVDNTQLTFSSDLKTWKTISAYSHGTPFYCEADGYFYCIKISKVSNKAQVALKKMTAWNVFSSAIIVDTSEENTSYLSSHNGGLYKLGNYYALPYTFDWSDINQHKIAFTQNFQTWNVIEYYRGTGGIMENVFKDFGYKEAKAYPLSSKKLQKILTNPHEIDKYIFTGGTINIGSFNFLTNEYTIDKKMSLYGGHAYRIDPILLDNNKIIYKASNPWNSSHDVFLTFEELEAYFSRINIAKI